MAEEGLEEVLGLAEGFALLRPQVTEAQLINRKTLSPNQTARPWTRSYHPYPLSTMDENQPA